MSNPRLITTAYSEHVTSSVDVLVQALEIPIEVIHDILRDGAFSFPMAESEYNLVVSLLNSLISRWIFRPGKHNLAYSKRAETVRAAGKQKKTTGAEKTAKKARITNAYSAEIAYSREALAGALHLPVNAVHQLAKSGGISFPITEEEYKMLSALLNAFCAEEVVKLVLAKRSVAKRMALVMSAGMGRMEREAYNLALRLKVEYSQENGKKKRYISYDHFVGILAKRSPNGVMRVKKEDYKRAMKAADYEIGKARRAGTFELLVKSLDMGYDDLGQVICKRRVDERTLRRARQIEESSKLIARNKREREDNPYPSI